MPSPRLLSWLHTWAYVALLILLAEAAPATAEAQLFSPGDLARVHSDLNSDTDCTQCHQEGKRGVEASLCNDCHDDIGRDRKKGRGLHGTEFKKDNCGHCHVEHRGESHDLIRWPGGSQKGFEHDMTGFSLTGGHKGPECNECHTKRNRRGAKTFLETPNTCVGCHKKDDVHRTRFGKDCAKCHTDRDWKGNVDKIDHDLTRFPLRGKHDDVKCVDCHKEPPKYRDMDFKTCASCHKDPHKGRLGGDCVSCHKESGWDDLTMSRAQHPGLRITAGHKKAKCNDCHDQGLLEPPSKGVRCVNCHSPVHEAKFGNNCKRCHAPIRWLGLPDAIGRDAHDKTVFPLRGEHAEAPCKGCHLPRLPQAKRYRGLSYARCNDCHEDVHGGKLSRFGDGDCTTCHDVHGFRPTLFSVEEHASARFPLVGRHVAVPCNSCHKIEPPRLDWTVTRQECADCHENPHGDQFAMEMAQGGCATCHSPVAWSAPNIDHSTWPLNGAHQTTACGSCHDPTEEDRKAGSGASYRGVPRDCEGCHADVHMGQFRLTDPARGCDECHTTTQFAIDDFDHALKADYPLTGKHADLECSSCHKRDQLANGVTAVRYRLLYRECSDCHADPHIGASP